MRKDRIKCLLSGLFLFVLTVSLQGAPGVNILGVQQRWPWNGLVDITYYIDCADRNFDGSPVDIEVRFSGYDQVRNQVIEMKHLSGDGADGFVQAGHPYKITWDGKKDYPNLNSLSFQVRVKAETRPKIVAAPKIDKTRYLVIELAKESEAGKFPFRFSESGPDLGNDACRTTELWLREIPAGTFMMGSPETEPGHSSEESLHQVTLTSSFYLGVLEVTEKQWRLVMGNQNQNSSSGVYPARVSYNAIRGWIDSQWKGWPQEGNKVNQGSFLEKLREKTGLLLDLPTEAQWEYACRAGTESALNSGKNLMALSGVCENLNELGRYDQSQNGGAGGGRSVVKGGGYKPNRWGLYDMHGNVGEWCLDWYSTNLGQKPEKNPTGVSGDYEDRRVLRGGDYMSMPRDCRSASRDCSRHNCQYYYGFRLACIPIYMVIDLSGGSTAKKYPVRYSIIEPDIEKDICRTTEMWFRRVPAGTFMMGSPENELGRCREEDSHQVTLTQSFYMGIFEVTRWQWKLVQGYDSVGYERFDCPMGAGWYEIRGLEMGSKIGWPKFGHVVAEDSFLGKLQKRTGLVLDLPTEAQWEYACRAGTTTALNSGKDLTAAGENERCSNLDAVGRYLSNQKVPPGKYMADFARVGSYLPNAWGLYDMHGNISEHCLDFYQKNLGTSAVVDPVGPNYEIRNGGKVMRGGGCLSYGRYCRSAYRDSTYPGTARWDGLRIIFIP